MKEKKHNYFYKITNSINGKYYYGIRSTNKEIENDKYFGSGIALKSAIKGYGKENFIKEIIADYPTRKEVSDHEKLVVTFELIQLEECYNCRTGGDNNYIFTDDVINKMKILKQNISVETRFKIGQSCKGIKRTEEFKQNLHDRMSGEKNPFYGKKHTDEVKNKISKCNSGKNNAMFGKKVSKEVAEKISKSNTGKKRSDEVKKKISESKKGHNHTTTISCYIDDIFFESLTSVAIAFNISKSTVTNRLKSSKFPTWTYFQQ